MNYEAILYEIEDNILTITLNRPEKLNAFNNIMQNDLINAIDRANDDDEVKAIIVTGSGRGYCAGADLSAGKDTFNMEARDDRKGAISESGEIDWSHSGVRDGGGRVTLKMFECLKPIISACNGPAVGVGITMQLAMDIRLASEQAKYGFVFARRGLVPEACSSWFLPRIVGVSKALEFFIKENDDLNYFDKIFAQRRLTARAWRFSKKVAKVSFFSKWFLYYMIGFLRFPFFEKKICELSNKIYEDYLD